LETDPDVLAAHLEDAAHFPGGHAAGLVDAADEADVASALLRGDRILAVGAQSSLTGGATPFGDVVVTTSRLNRILELGRDFVRVEAGVPLIELDRLLEREARYYPPGPTFRGAFVGGTVATNAAGAATFKYGTTREWVRAITVVLPDGDVVEVRRGETTAHPDGYFELELARGTVRVPAPRYRRPSIAKVSAGYFAADSAMDLIDLFIGSEGTLGVVTEVTLAVLPGRPATCLAFVPFSRSSAALAFAAALRDAAALSWRTNGAAGVDVSAIEHMDARSLALLGEDGADRKFAVRWPDSTAVALLVTIELAPGVTTADAYDAIGRAHDDDAPDESLTRFCRMLAAACVFDVTEIALPGDVTRANQLLALREAVPEAVNRRVGLARRSVDGRIAKTAADVVVPFERLPELIDIYNAEFLARRLDTAVWGHLSDGNLHPNVIPRSFDDVEAGKSAILAIGRAAIGMGGSPLAEHGVGRHSIKQQLLRELYGDAGIEQMRAVKRAIDPRWKLAPGVLFSAEA
jgi:D-lactate dehydrogenase (cytochrome)